MRVKHDATVVHNDASISLGHRFPHVIYDFWLGYAVLICLRNSCKHLITAGKEPVAVTRGRELEVQRVAVVQLERDVLALLTGIRIPSQLATVDA